jgi:ABC-type uncharacterized transport system permease subunit
MNYVEWLRVRGCLKWTAIVLVVGVGLVLFARFTYLDIRPHAAGFSGVFIADKDLPAFERESRQTQSKLADGTVRTVIDNPARGIRVTIDDHGYWGKHVEVFEKNPPAGVHAKKINFGDIHAQRLMVPGGSLVKIDTGALVPEDLSYYFILATLVALIVATILGAPFARENEGHLELALTKPISRVNLALQTIATDFAGIAAAFVMTVIFLIVGHTIFEAPNYTYGPNDTIVLAIGLLGACSWYALLNASTASMKRSYGGVLGCAWPIALGIGGIAHAPLGDSPLAGFIRWIASALSWLFPTSYLHLASMSGIGSEERTQTLTSSSLTPETILIILAVLALVYGAAAIFQWRRVEA